MFAVSSFAFWRGEGLRQMLEDFSPDAIWMHSVLRYVGVWGMMRVSRFSQKHPEVALFLSHHDVGLIAPFPQSITEERQIPEDASLIAFLPKELSLFRMLLSALKWCYVHLLCFFLPSITRHIIFAPFLEKHIRAHFPNQEIIILPHTVDEKIFHP